MEKRDLAIGISYERSSSLAWTVLLASRGGEGKRGTLNLRALGTEKRVISQSWNHKVTSEG